ncbi:hypothetical protein R83H12_03058 [Fibrobacteria bacterium R8-3-H12]
MLRLLILCAVFSIVACAGSRSGADSDKTTEVMITFVQRAQAGFWKEAMENVSVQERSDMMDGVNVMQEYKDAVNRIRLSTIKNMDLSLDRSGRLLGLKDILDESNERYVASDEKVVIDPSKLEDLAAWRQKREEEAAKKAREEPPKEEKPTWLDAYYGNTKSGGGGRVVKEEEEEGE